MKKEYLPSIVYEIEPCELKGIFEWDQTQMQLRLICNKSQNGVTVFAQIQKGKHTYNTKVIHLIGPEDTTSLEAGIKMLLRSGIFDFDKLFEEALQRK